ncbi:MAG: alpha/beta fold hydrolase [Solirubrobacteraceae bacterium]
MTRTDVLTTPGRPRLHVASTGDGQAVLGITGWTISSAVFRPFAAMLPDGFRAITYDHPGSGCSERAIGPVSVASLAADAVRVLDACRVGSAHVVGLSLGAAVALELAVRMPWRVRSLALVGGWSGGPASVLPGPRAVHGALTGLARDSVRRRRLWPAAVLFSPSFLATTTPDRLEAAVEPFLERRGGTWTAATQTVAASCFNRRRSLETLRCPTLVAHGDQDVMSPVENARRMAAAIPGARLEIVPGGHAFPFEDLAATDALCRSWFTEVAGADPPARPTASGVVRERLTRPFALHTGAARNQRDLLLRLARRT